MVKKKNQKNVIMWEKFKDWFYYLKNGHPFLLEREANIICETRFDDEFKWMNDYQIQDLIRLKVKRMYETEYPNAKRFSLANF